MAEQVDGGLTAEDKVWIQRQLALAVAEEQANPSAPRPVWLDQVMPYAPALLLAWLVAVAVFVWSTAVEAPRVWPGVVTGFVLMFAQQSWLTWLAQRRKSRRRGGARG